MRAGVAVAIALLASRAGAATPAWQPSPDRLAWQVFTQMAAPAKSGVQYESWASDTDLYGPAPKWPSAAAPKLLQPSLGGAASLSRPMLTMVASPSACAKPQDGAAGNFPPDACIGEEVRHNRPVFDYLSSNGLITVAGLVKAYAERKQIALPADSVVAKADWVPIGDILKWRPQYKTAAEVRRAYYTNTASEGGKSAEYALVGISVQSKQLKDWLWMTFEHRSNPGRCDVIGCHDSFGAAMPNVAPASTGNSDYGACAKTPALLALFAKLGLAPVWSNYCLKGTQTRYRDPAGNPTRLGNSVIERMNHGIPIPQISCITCHAYASFDAKGGANYTALKKTPVGAIDWSLLQGYDRDDFIWGFLSAK